jgi:hypothetical protein
MSDTQAPSFPKRAFVTPVARRAPVVLTTSAGMPVALPIAKPARKVPRYVMPGSHWLDPPYSWEAQPTWPFPRPPRAFESETRAAGTGLIWGPR